MMLNQKNYFRCDEMRSLSLNSLYEGNSRTLNDLDYNLEAIVSTEAPICLDLLKARLRAAFGIGKISQKALDIIMDRLDKLGIIITEDHFDLVLWPSDGAYDVKYVRVNGDRNIYQIPEVEMKLVYNHFKESCSNDDELYHKILNFFGYQTLTAKALEYFSAVSSLK